MFEVLRKTVQLGIDVIDFGRKRLTGLIGFDFVSQRQIKVFRQL
ncbi:hypothetical protein ALP71_01320 [Pseudomonas coronafaciens pv. garcae]|nr:hypothetical protein ALP71_01320 [Pseudomonas coronafaciens pv. garcae]